MPTFDITAPDGRKFRVTGPEGSTKEQALAQVQSTYKPQEKTDTSTGRALDLIPQAAHALNKGVNDIGLGVLKGGIEGVAGMMQSEAGSAISPLLGLAKQVPGVSDAFTRGVKHVTDWIDSSPEVTLAGTLAKGDPQAAMRQAGEIIGQTLPYVMAPEAAVTKGVTLPARLLENALKGGAAGYMGFQPGATEADRTAGRLKAAAGGAALSVPLTGTSALVSKFANSRAVAKSVGAVRDWFADADPALQQVRRDVNVPMAKIQKTFEQKSVDLARHQDLLGPIPLKDEEGYLETIANKVASMTGISDKGLSGAVKRTLDRLAPQFVEPETITTRAGVKFVRQGPSKYVMEGTDKVLPAQAAKTMLDAQKRKTPLTATYTQIKSAVDNLDAELSKSKVGDTAGVRATALELKKSLEKKLADFETPGLRAHADAVERWKEKAMGPLMNPALKPVVEAGDSVSRANAVLKLALGDDEPAARTAGLLVGQKGREAVFRGVVKKALDEAMDLPSGQYDAAKFAKFFEGKAGLKSFMDARVQRQVDGIRNLLTDSALRQGASPKVHIPRIGGGLVSSFGIYRLATGHIKEGLTEIGASLATRPLFAGVEKLLNDSFGRNLLAAAGAAKPGSPRMARVVQQITNRFLTPAGGAVASQATR